MTTIHQGAFLTLHYRLSGPDGAELVNTFGANPATLSLGAGELSPAVEARLIGLPEGAHESFDLGPGEAFGPHNATLVRKVSRALLARWGDADEQYQVGDVVRFPAPDGQPHSSGYAGVVREVADDGLVFDFNHPLAGQPVRFEVQVIGVL